MSDYDYNIFFNTNISNCTTNNNVSDDICIYCGGSNWDDTRDGNHVCTNCGACDGDYRQLVFNNEEHKYTDEGQGYEAGEHVKYPRKWRGFGNRKYPDWLPKGIKLQTRGTINGRYKHIFHYNERIAQWVLLDPSINKDDFNRIREESISGKYGAISEFSRSTIITVVKNLNLSKYRERWKQILWKLYSEFSPEVLSDYVYPSNLLVDKCLNVFQRLISAFYTYRPSMETTVIRGIKKKRHNFPNFNYTHRKILEGMGIYIYHDEFPVPRSWKKLKALDDIMEKMMNSINYPFSRSVIIKRPKLRKRKKKNNQNVTNFSESLFKTDNKTEVKSIIYKEYSNITDKLRCLNISAGRFSDNQYTWE